VLTNCQARLARLFIFIFFLSPWRCAGALFLSVVSHAQISWKFRLAGIKLMGAAGPSRTEQLEHACASWSKATKQGSLT
jgi:hypothetical protein